MLSILQIIKKFIATNTEIENEIINPKLYLLHIT